MAIDQNPFAILTFIAAPAVLTNASSVLALGTSNRFARNVDRARVLIKFLEESVSPTHSRSSEETTLWRHLLSLLQSRSRLLVRALSAFYFAIGSFAAASLMSLLGAIVASGDQQAVLKPILILALLTGAAGLVGMIYGGVTLVSETRLALRAIDEEARFFRELYLEAPRSQTAI